MEMRSPCTATKRGLHPLQLEKSPRSNKDSVQPKVKKKQQNSSNENSVLLAQTYRYVGQNGGSRNKPAHLQSTDSQQGC